MERQDNSSRVLVDSPGHVDLAIEGITVKFPKQPYDCQVQYMAKVISALRQGKNALLESPTGTGKTLCLLCSSLAWQNAPRSSGKADSKGVIIYATRTHSQLTQVVHELRNTAYRPRMAVLGSRDQLCSHEKISKLKGSILNHACNSINAKRGCLHRNNLEGFLDSNVGETHEIMDIEDLAKIGAKKKICPYYYSRDYSSNSEIIFMPYNYLLDNSIRKTLKVSLENAVVIFDEAHNLEKVAADSASFSLSSADIAACIQELQQVLRLLKEQETMTMSAGLSSEEIPSGFGQLGGNSVEKPTLAMTAHILKAIFSIESQLDAVDLQPNVVNETPGAKYPGIWLVELFFRSGLNDPMYVEEIRRCSNLLMEAAEDAMNGGDGTTSSAPAPVAEPKLALLAQAVDRILRSGQAGAVDYKVYICEAPLKNSKFPNQYENRNNASVTSSKKRVINFWCFSTGVALKELTTLGVKSLIITSGTLSPIEAMKEDLKVPFQVELQNPHIISTQQILVAAMNHGVSGQTLNSSFHHRDTTAYKDELGNTILAICDALVLSDRDPLTEFTQGGVLVFFPSYKIMENTVERWKFVGIYDRMLQLMKQVIAEPKSGKPANDGKGKPSGASGNNSAAAKKNFMLGDGDIGGLRARDESGEEEVAYQSIVTDFDKTIAQRGRCLLLAVCRGKVSEGIDFSNNKGRVVIITGIPFAPHLDPWVVLKKEFLDDKANGVNSIGAIPTVAPVVVNPYGSMPPPPPTSATMNPYQASTSGGNLWLAAKTQAAVAPSAQSQPPQPVVGKTSGVNRNLLTGQMWYNQSALRAVNQCLGRVIRHRNDWGAVFLLDERFQYDHQISQLSAWMRPCVQKPANFNSISQNFNQFLRRINNDPQLRYDPKKVLSESTNGSGSSRPNNRSVTLNYEKREKDPFEKFIEVSSTQLAQGGDDQFFISKDMIVSTGTLQGSVPARGNHTLRHHDASKSEDDFSTFSSQLMSSDNRSQAVDVAPKDLKSLINRLKRPETSTLSDNGHTLKRNGSLNQRDRESLPQHSSTSVSSTVVTSSSANQTERRVLRNMDTVDLVDDTDDAIFGADSDPVDVSSTQATITMSQPTSKFGFAGLFSQASASSSSKGISIGGHGNTARAIDFASDISSVPSTQFIMSQPDSTSSKTVARMAPPSLSMSQRLSSASRVNQQQHAREEREKIVALEIRGLLDDAKAQMSERGCLELKRWIEGWRQRGGLRSIAQIAPFQSDLIGIFDRYESDPALRQQALQTLLCLVSDPSIVEAYKTQASQRNLAQNKRPLSAVTSSSSSGPSQGNTQPIPSLTIPSKGVDVTGFGSKASFGGRPSVAVSSEDIENMGSKRAKRMLMLSSARSTGGSTSASSTSIGAPDVSSSQSQSQKPTLLSKLRELGKPESLAVKTMAPQVMLAPQKIAHVKCSICMEADDPLRAQCGHICCKDCWQKQLKVKAVCPICRTATTTEQLYRIRIASSSVK